MAKNTQKYLMADYELFYYKDFENSLVTAARADR